MKKQRVSLFLALVLITNTILLSGCGIKQSYINQVESSENKNESNDSNKKNPDTKEPSSNAESFEEFLDTVFKDEVTSNMINLHYTLKDPSSYGIDSYEVTLGDLSKEQRENNQKELLEFKDTLQTFDKDALTLEQQFTYDILSDYIDTQLQIQKYELFEEPLKPSNGLQSQLPVLYAEYTFSNKKDVEDYLKMIAQTDTYYSQIMQFEAEKVDAGLFMSDQDCNDVIEECESFLENPSDNFLLTTFTHRMEQAEFLTPEEKEDYIQQNIQAVNDHVLPAYQILIDGLGKCMGSGKNNWGVCYFENGKDYYELLVKSNTGSSHSVEELFDLIEEQRSDDLIICSNLQKENSQLLEQCLSYELAEVDPSQMVTTLSQMIENDFPTPPAVNHKICYVDSALEDYLAPAFYITATIDDYTDNVIYINPKSNYSGIDLFTTLAHEGYPGHLYQTVMSYNQGLEPLRSLLDYPGYTEGWATYVEMLSYSYSGLEEKGASLLSHNQAASLSLYASSDIGLHYYGWTKDDMYDFWEQYGITDSDTVDKITGIILADPGNYLKYYIGYLSFLELKNKMQNRYMDDFTNLKFHETILKMGPAPFYLLEKYFSRFYSQTSSTTDLQSSKENSGYCPRIRFFSANSSV